MKLSWRVPQQEWYVGNGSDTLVFGNCARGKRLVLDFQLGWHFAKGVICKLNDSLVLVKDDTIITFDVFMGDAGGNQKPSYRTIENIVPIVP